MESVELKTPFSWKDRPVFVTGATGLVGSWLVKELLEQEADVTVLLRDLDPQSELIRKGLHRESRVINGALEEIDTLERALSEGGIDTVFHLGAQTLVNPSYRHPLNTFESNVRGTYLLLEACRRQASTVNRIVVASSDKAYGASDRLPYDENQPLRGRGPYDVSKSCCDLIAQSYAFTYDQPLAIARCGNIFGGGDLNWSRIVPGTILSCLKGKAPEIRSNGLFTRDYLYIKDAVLAYLLLAERLHEEGVKGEAFNFSTDRPLKVLEIVALIQSLYGGEVLAPRILNQARAEIPDQTLSSEKARTRLGWICRYSLEKGLKETLDWYTDYLSQKKGTLTPCQDPYAAFAAPL